MPSYPKIILRLPWDYLEVFFRSSILSWDNPEITPRLPRDYPEVTLRLLQGYLEISPRFPYFILIGWFPITPFQMLNFHQSLDSKLGLIIIKLPKAPLHLFLRYYVTLKVTNKLTLKRASKKVFKKFPRGSSFWNKNSLFERISYSAIRVQ